MCVANEWREFSSSLTDGAFADFGWPLCVPPCRKRKYVRVLTHFKAIYFFYVHNNLCSAFSIRVKKYVEGEGKEKKKKTNQQITSHARRHTSEYKITNNDSAVYRRQTRHYNLYQSRNLIVPNITIAFYFWLFVRTHSHCIRLVHSFLFSHSRFSHFWFNFSKREIFRAARLSCRSVSQVEFSLNVRFVAVSPLPLYSHHVMPPRYVLFSVLSPAG